MAAPPPPLPVRNRSWWDRNWKWFVPLLAVACLGAVAAFALGVMAFLKKAEPYQIALARARAHPTVIAALGTPIEDGYFVTGSRQFNATARGRQGTVVLSTSLSGPKGKGALWIQASQSNGPWRLDTAVVKVEGRSETIDLSDAAARK
jgi:hypothetical protein